VNHVPTGTELAPGYEVVFHLARGRILDVYEVWSEERGSLCIGKTLRPDHVGKRADRKRLRDEGKLLLDLSHPHIVRAYDLVERPHPVLILETLGGATLAHLARDGKRRLSAADVAHVGLHLCSALGYVHRRGYLHLDVKPSNIVAENGRAKVIDFSLARPPGRGRRGLGTRQYMAPEQALGNPFTSATDIWGLGATLYEAATGLRPFAADEDEVEHPQLERRADSVRTLRRGLPMGLSTTIDVCLEPEPPDRPPLDDVEESLLSVVS
jgi:serine/threonine protein kinase